MKNYLEEYYIEPELIVRKKDSDSETSDNEYVPAEDTTNTAPAEQEKEKEKEEENKESDIVVIDGLFVCFVFANNIYNIYTLYTLHNILTNNNLQVTYIVHARQYYIWIRTGSSQKTYISLVIENLVL